MFQEALMNDCNCLFMGASFFPTHVLWFNAKSLVFGTTLLIDELDAKIHPVLLEYVIMLYNNMEINKHGAQLIFTSHDLSTMNNEVFRRDEIWFVVKGNSQNSKLYSLVEFKTGNGEVVRKDAKYDKQYLEGKYGADPYLRKRSRMIPQTKALLR